MQTEPRNVRAALPENHKNAETDRASSFITAQHLPHEPIKLLSSDTQIPGIPSHHRTASSPLYDDLYRTGNLL